MDQGHRIIAVFIRGMPVFLAVNYGFILSRATNTGLDFISPVFLYWRIFKEDWILCLSRLQVLLLSYKHLLLVIAGLDIVTLSDVFFRIGIFTILIPGF